MQAYRSDVISTIYKREIEQLEQNCELRPQRTIGCPIEGCGTTYEVFDPIETTHRKNVRELRALLAKSHPHHHSVGKITLNGDRHEAAA